MIDPHDYNKRVAQTAVTLLSDGDTLEVPLYVPAEAFAAGTLTGTVYHRDGTVWPGADGASDRPAPPIPTSPTRPTPPGITPSPTCR